MDEGFEYVYVETERYDGPKAGVADVNGVPHYFHWAWSPERPDAGDDEFLVWPIDAETLALERERWRIFATTHEFGSGETPTAEAEARHAELADLLDERGSPPAGARRLRAEWRFRDDELPRFRVDGTDYVVRWHGWP